MNVYGINIFNRAGIETPGVGKILPIEILKKLDDRVSLIRFNGLEINARVKADIKEGERFYARVQSMEDGLLVLEKLKVNKGQDIETRFNAKDPVRLFIPLQQQGKELSQALPKDPQSIELLQQAAIQNSDKITPKAIEQYIKNLGLNYEKILYELLKQDRSTIKNNPILEELKNTIKGKALSNPNTQELVEWLTRQQFWLDAGEHNQFMILFLLIRQGEQLRQFRVASLSPRNKESSDKSNFRIGLTAESEQLGKIGVEARVYEKSISLQVLTDEPETLKELVKLTHTESVDSLQKAGYTLTGVNVCAWDNGREFELFMEGQIATEVDLWV